MKQETNIPFCLLSVLGIIFVVDGHLNHSFFDIEGLIPYYAFHMPLFVFISGYFFRMKEGESLWRFAKTNSPVLMIPYYLWNLIYGLLAAFLRRNGFLFWSQTLDTLLLEPFCLGYQFIFEPCGLVCSFPFSYRACLQNSDLESVLEKGRKSMQIPFFPDPCGRNCRYFYVQKCRK